MVTKYPVAIDGYAQIRVARDNIDEIIAGDHNDLRSAVISIERTLGINPQGPFGTVVARLNDAYSNIEAHVLGNPPRHQDSVIMSPNRIGALPVGPPLDVPPYTLPGGMLANQITGILGFLNDSLMYAGSGATTFADGYALGFSLIRNAITQIVGQLGGGATGTTKISGDILTAVNFPNIPAGTLSAQLVGLLDLIDAFGGPTGANFVGTTGFTTSTGNKYTFLSTNVHDQIEEAGNFLDEGASFREKAFNAFVASGMAVTNDGGGDADISAGFIAANGRMVKYNGGGVVVPNGVTSYIYAEIVNGIVNVDIDVAIPTRPLNPVVLLHRIVRAGIAWTAEVDLRRYGMLSNDKNYVSVGRTPVGGRDGYGCDFLSLNSAVEYAKIVNGGAALIPPLKIILASDLTITTLAEMQVLLDVSGIEIDGCRRKVTTTVDAPLFRAEANNITIKDLVLESNLAISGSALCLARVGNGTSVTNLTVTNCKLLATGATPCPFFLRMGNVGATTTVSRCLISGNIALVESGGIEYTSVDKYKQVLRDSVIEGNQIYQSTFGATIYAGIKASQHCTISDNIIKGGFESGILLAFPTQCRVDGNLIIGYQAATIHMTNGISVWNSVAAQDNGCVISDNTIKGINIYGIDCAAGIGSGVLMAIYGNLIDNFFSVGVPPGSMVGIRGGGDDTWIVGNKITAPGDFGIQNCSHAIGNQIIGNFLVPTTIAAIHVVTTTTAAISDNVIVNVSGVGIDVNNNTDVVVSNNIMVGNASATTAINNIDAECIITGNLIKDYTSNAIRSIAGNEITVTNNRIIDCGSRGITFADCAGAIVSHNWLECVAGFGSAGIYGTGSYSIIAHNYIANYGLGGFYGITLQPAVNVDTLIVGNIIKSLHAATGGALTTPGGGWSKISVIDNIVEACPATGFDFGDATQILCANNTLSGIGTSSSAIVGFGTGSIINGNIIESYCANFTETAILAVVASDDIVITNNNITADNGIGINCNSGSRHLVANNSISGMASGNAGDHGITNIGRESIVANNVIVSPNDYGLNILGDSCIINGNLIKDAPSYGLYITANRCVLSNNYIYQSGGEGMRLDGALNSLVSNNYLYQTDNGFNVVGSSDHTILIGNYTYQTQDTFAYQIDNSDHCALIGNKSMSDPADAIYVSASSNVQICGNCVFDCGGFGIQTSANRSFVNGNYIYNAGSNGVYIGVAAVDSSISNNYIYNSTSYGIYALSGANRLLINGNMIQYSGDHAIYLVQNNFCCISNNHIYQPTNDGIHIEGASDNTSINGNWIYSPSVYGLYLGGTSVACLVNGNWIRDAVWSGMWIGTSATEASICGNYVKRCGGGAGLPQIDLAQCSDFLCVGNSVTDPSHANSIGIDMNTSDGGLCVGNRAVVTGALTVAIVYTAASNYVIEGNMCRGGASPGGVFGALPLVTTHNGWAV